MRKYSYGIFGQVTAYRKRFLRDKTALFFTFLFPLIFLFVFGSIYGGSDDISLKVVVIDQSNSSMSKQVIKSWKESDDLPLDIQDEVDDIDSANKLLDDDVVSAIILLAPGFGSVNGGQAPSGQIKVLHKPGSDQEAQVVTAVVGQMVDSLNRSLGRPDPQITIATEPVGEQGLSSFDYVFSGLLAFSLMSMGVFGLANQMPSEKQKGSYRRLRSAPFSSGQLIIATAIHYVGITLLSLALMIVVGMLVFNFDMRGDWLNLTLFAVLSSILTVGFGLLIGAWAKNENQSAPIGNIVAFPMMFLSGAFFPTFLFPEWLRSISQLIPLTPVVDGFRMIMTENAQLTDLGVQLGIMSVWIVAVYFASMKLFRWD